MPAFGPKSIIWSEFRIISLSCSTTITEFPESLSFFNELISLILSFWWSPILGSSNIYNTPTSWEPTWVANLTLWASPPDKDFVDLDRVKYSNPTSIKNWILIKISLLISSDILRSFFDKLLFKSLNQSLSSERSISVNSKIFFLLILKDLDSIFNLLPSHALHLLISTNCRAHLLKLFDSLFVSCSLIKDSIPI